MRYIWEHRIHKPANRQEFFTLIAFPLPKHIYQQMMKLSCPSALERLCLENLADEGIGFQQYIVAKDNVINANGAFLAQLHVI